MAVGWVPRSSRPLSGWRVRVGRGVGRKSVGRWMAEEVDGRRGELAAEGQLDRVDPRVDGTIELTVGWSGAESAVGWSARVSWPLNGRQGESGQRMGGRVARPSSGRHVRVGSPRVGTFELAVGALSWAVGGRHVRVGRSTVGTFELAVERSARSSWAPNGRHVRVGRWAVVDRGAGELAAGWSARVSWALRGRHRRVGNRHAAQVSRLSATRRLECDALGAVHFRTWYD
jgi:hypothetical protein